MPQVYATVYDATSVLVFTKNRQGRFFEGTGPGGVIRNGPGRPCFPGGRLNRGEATVSGAIREFREETGIPLATVPVSFTNADNASCHFFPLPEDTTMEQMRERIAAELVLANGGDWEDARARGDLHIQDNELASVAIVPWADLPGDFFPDDEVTGWFRGFVNDMKARPGIG